MSQTEPLPSQRELVRVSFRCSVDDHRRLKELAARRSTTVAQVIHEALGTEHVVQQQLDAGATIMAYRRGRARELVFPHMEDGS